MFFSSKNKKNKNNARDVLSTREYKDSIRFYFPIETFADETLIITKYGGFAKIFEITNKDLDFIDNIDRIMEDFNKAFLRLDSGFTLHYETQKIRTSSKKEVLDNYAPIPLRLSNEIRNSNLARLTGSDFYEIKHYLTISYIPNQAQTAVLDKLMLTSNKKEENKNTFEKEWNKMINEFNATINDLMIFLEKAIVSVRILSYKEALPFLYNTINPLDKYKKLVVPNYGYPIDDFLSVSGIRYDGDDVLLGDEYLKVISINAFPNVIVPEIFRKLENLDFEFRIVNRYIALSKEEAVSVAKGFKRHYYGKRKTFFQYFFEALNGSKNMDETDVDKQAIEMSQQAGLAIDFINKGEIAYGYYTFTLIISDKDLEKLNEKCNKAMNIIKEQEFTCSIDRFNTLDAYLGAMPANITANIRKVPLDSMVFAYLLPTSSIYQGQKTIKHFGNKPALITTISNNQLFYFSNMVEDVGHTLILGPTGAGKSTLLGTMALNFLKYSGEVVDPVTKEKVVKPARVFFFDKDASSKILTYSCGGKFYDIGGSSLSFQPLRNIHIEYERQFAEEFILSLIETQDDDLANKLIIKNAVRDALMLLSHNDVESRTLTNFNQTVQNVEIREALKPFCRGGSYGTYFDSNKDAVDVSRMTTFELGKLMNTPSMMIPTLNYLFHKIEEEYLTDGVPTMIILDECWLYLKNEYMRNKIEDWLRVLRKKNAAVVFATQSLDEVVKSPIASVLSDSCRTKIFLPNPQAKENYVAEYRKYNLSNKTILTINNAMSKRQYIYTSPYGVRVFDLALSDVELAYVGTSDLPHQDIIEEIKKISGDDIVKLNEKWLKHQYGEGKIGEYSYSLIFREK